MPNRLPGSVLLALACSPLLAFTPAHVAADLEPSATSVAFGNVIYGGSPGVSTVVLKNTTTGKITLSSIAITGNSDFTATNSCGTSIAAGAGCAVTISFAPHAIGARAGTLKIVSTAANSPLTIALTGTGCRYFSPAAARFFLTSC